MRREKREVVAILERIVAEITSDPETRKMSEEYQRRYGVLTEEDLRKTFTI